MLSKSISTMILNALTKGQSSAQSIASSAYLALLTTLPDNQGVGAVEVSGTTMKGYSRLLLGSSGNGQKSLDNKDFFPAAGASWDSTENAYKVQNTANMQMSAIEEGVTATATVVGFAICKSVSGALTADMLAWGPLVDANGAAATVSLTGGSVPIFYYNSTTSKGDFTLLLGAAAAANS